MMGCPFCEQGRFETEVIKAIDLFHERGVHLTKSQARIMAALIEKRSLTTINSLIGALWFDTDEPEWSESSLKVQLSKCRAKIKQAKFPWRIRSVFGVGYILETSEGKVLKSVGLSLALTLLCIYPILG